MSVETDLLMSKNPLDLTAEDVEAIVLEERKARLMWEGGVKPKKEKGPTIDISSVVQALIPKTTSTDPKVTSTGLRRRI